MAHIHLTRELLLAVSRGERPSRLLLQLGLDHLLGLCPYCLEEFQSFERLQRRHGDHGTSLRSFSALLERNAGTTRREEERAAKDFRELLSLSPEERLRKANRARGRFRGRALAQLLIEESRKRVTIDPAEAFSWADLARFVVQLSPSGDIGLLTLAAAHMANARRAGGDLRKAEEHFAYARYLAIHQGVTDPAVIARLDDLEGSLRKDQRRFQEASQLLSRAVLLYGLSGAEVEIGRTLLKLGDMHDLQGLPDKAIETTRAALTRLPVDTEPWLYLCGRFNIAFFLAGAGRWEEAADIVETDEDLYRRFPEPWVQLRLAWVRARIAAGSGDIAEAERLYLEVREGFIRQGIGYDAAIASLELALLYVRQERTVELKRLAEEMLSIFRSQNIHREATAALMLFQDAARREVVTVALLRDLSAYLDAARHDPAMVFRHGEKSER